MVPVVPRLLHSLRFNSFRTPHPFSLISSSGRQIGRGNANAWFRMGTHNLSSAVELSEFQGDELPDDAKTTERDTALRMALLRLASDFGRESRLSLQRFFGARRAPVISTGSLKLDLALGIGGLPKGRMVEIFGQEASGKTTLVLHIIKEAQKLGGYCAYLDVENALDPMLAEAIGVKTENLLISQPDSAENLLSVVNTLTQSGSVDVIVVDSVAALIPQCELDIMIGESKVDIRSKMMTQALRKIHRSLYHSATLIVFVNQVRANVKSGQGFGHTDVVTCGGNALRFYSAVRLRLMRKGLLKTEDKFTGIGIRVEVVKNKLAPASKTAELGIQFGRGICCESESEILELACEHGVVLKDGNRYLIEGELLNGKEEAENYLGQSGLLDKMIRTLRNRLFET